MVLDPSLLRLRSAGFRITLVRSQIIKIISASDQPLSAGQILNLLPVRANKTTVYRELKFLHNHGLLTPVDINPKVRSYESSELSHHHHLICETCGRIQDVTNCLDKKILTQIRLQKGFLVHRHSLEFYGLCLMCQNKSQ